MPENITNELIYEVLKSIQSQVSAAREDLDMIKGRTSSMERRIGDILAEMGRMNERMDRIDMHVRSLQRFEQAHDAFERPEA